MIRQETLVEEYALGRRFYAVFGILTVALLVGGIYLALSYEWRPTGGATVVFWLSALFLGAAVGPYVVQYALLRGFGVRPLRKRWGTLTLVPHLIYWWEIGDQKLTGRGFAIVHGVPALLVCTVVIVYLLRFPTAAPVGAFLPVYLGNFWCALLALRQPEGTLVENSGRGLRFYKTELRGVLESHP